MDGRRVGRLSAEPARAPVPSSGGSRLFADAAVCAGLVVAVVGTFLPWVRSGRADRDIYAAGGLLKRLVGVHGFDAIALDVLPFLALGCGVVIALIMFGHGARAPWSAVVGRVGAIVVALVAGAGAIAALNAHSRFGVSPADAGPAAELSGSAVTLIAAVTAFWVHRVRK